MPEDNSALGYILNALDKQSRAITTQSVTEKTLFAAVVLLTGWSFHQNARIARLERKVEKLSKRSEE